MHDLSRYASTVAQTIPSLEYVGLQIVADGEAWDEFCYNWFRVESHPESGPPVLEQLPEWKADALELELLATPRD